MIANEHKPSADQNILSLSRCAYPGCTYPDGQDHDRAFVEFEGLEYCEKHIGLVKAGKEFDLAVTPLVGTGDP